MFEFSGESSSPSYLVRSIWPGWRLFSDIRELTGLDRLLNLCGLYVAALLDLVFLVSVSVGACMI